MKRLIWLPIAGFLLIAGATVAAAAPTIADTAASIFAPRADSDSREGAASEVTVTSDSELDHPRPGALLEEVLADLVDQNVITQEQSDAITTALQARVDEQRAEMEARRELMQQTMEQVRGFLEDDVITQDEINQLPADSPLREAFTSIAENGQISLGQLRALGPGFGFGFVVGDMGPGGPGMRGPGHHGPGQWFEDPDASQDSNSDSDSDSGAE